MGDVTVVSGCYGGFDLPRPPAPQDVDVEWVMFTDDPDLVVPPPWRTVLEGPRHRSSRMAAKWPKTHPEVHGTRWVVWVDANMEIVSESFVREAVGCAEAAGVATWSHPQRDCIYREARASMRLAPAKYASQPLYAQVAAYRTEGHPKRAGLFACGTVVYDTSRPEIVALAHAWWEECDRWSYQDQLSFPVVCRRTGIEPAVFPHNQIGERGPDWLGNPWLHIHRHLSAA